MAGHGNTGSFNLPGCDPAAFGGLKAILSKSHVTSPGCLATHAAPLYFPVLNPLWHQHNSTTSVVTAKKQYPKKKP
jgi:hypothetical protein